MNATDILNLFRNLPFGNLDLLSVGIAIAATIILGFVVYINNEKSITNKTFLFFALTTAFWSIFNYVSYQTTDSRQILWLLRIVIFLAVWLCYFIFQFFYVYPSEKVIFSNRYKYLLVPFVAFVSILNLTHFVFSGVAEVSTTGSVSKLNVQGGVIFFILTVIGLLAWGITVFIKKIFKEKPDQRAPYKLVLWGTIITFILLFTFNLILPAVFSVVRYIPLGALFIFPFVASTFYAIYRHHLFNLRAATVAGLTFIITIASGFEIVLSRDPVTGLLRSGVFILVLAVGVLMNRFVETIAEQREELEQANEQQENLIHFISHEVKGYLTNNQAALSGILEGDFGAVPTEMRTMVEGALVSTRKGSDTVKEILSAANFKKGTVKYNMAPFDMKPVVMDVVSQLDSTAKAKGLTIEADIPEGTFELTGDKDQIEQHVIRNLIDNSIKYTPQGKITVGLDRRGSKILFFVKDTGIGISDEDKGRLFTQGGKGKESIKINVNSTGYGLYIAKNIVVAHNGRIWAESEGQGKGSQFYAEFV
jgi:signal transduction histidine kinase